MANTAQARKRARQAVKLNAHNSSQRSTLRTAIKAVRRPALRRNPVSAVIARSSRVHARIECRGSCRISRSFLYPHCFVQNDWDIRNGNKGMEKREPAEALAKKPFEDLLDILFDELSKARQAPQELDMISVLEKGLILRALQ